MQKTDRHLSVWPQLPSTILQVSTCCQKRKIQTKLSTPKKRRKEDVLHSIWQAEWKPTISTLSQKCFCLNKSSSSCTLSFCSMYKLFIYKCAFNLWLAYQHNKLILCRSVLQVKQALDFILQKIRNLIVHQFQGKTSSMYLKF